MTQQQKDEEGEANASSTTTSNSSISIKKTDKEIEVSIIFTSGQKKKIKIKKTETIQDLIDKLQKDHITTDSEPKDGKITVSGEHVQLISKGRFLYPENTLREAGIHSQEHIHCLVTRTPRQQQNTATRTIPERSNVSDLQDDESTGLLGTSVFRTEHDSDEEDHLRIRRGFDTMSDAGFSEDAIREFRNQFYATRQHLLRDVQAGRMTLDELQDIEEEWMEQEVSHPQQQQQIQEGTVAIGHYTGTSYDFLFGMMLGFFLGIIMIFWREEKATPTFFSIGVALGILFNIGITIIYVMISLL